MSNILFENIYDKLPASFQNIVFSLYGYKLKRERYNKAFFNYLDFLKKSEFWPAEKIYKYQNENLIFILRHAYQNIPFYKEWYDSKDIDINEIRTIEDLKYLPILTKEIVRQNLKNLKSKTIKSSDLVVQITSGTTGTPLKIYFTKESLAFQWAIWWRHKARFGIHIGDRHLVFGARVPISQKKNKPPLWREDFVNNRVYLSSYHISQKNLDSIVNYLNSTHFDFFTGYPSSIYLLAKLMDENGDRLYNRPKYIISGSEVLTDEFKDQIRKVFGVTITDQYGINEFAGNLSKCEYGNYHLDFECCALETESINKNNDYQSLIFTGWGNPTMPFIRYRIGDYGVVLKDKCPCGRESIALSEIDGRLEDFILTPDGRKIMGMNQVFKYASNARLIQIYQNNTNSIEVRVVPGKYFNQHDEDLLQKALEERIGKIMEIKIVKVEKIELPPSGKFKAVISEVK